MPFHFSIRDALKKSWTLYKTNFWYFSVLALGIVILNISPKEESILLSLVTVIAALIWSYVWLSSTLAAVDEKTDLLKLGAIGKHFPSLKQAWKFLLLGILVGLIIIGGLILLIIPGIYFMVRLAFTNLSMVDQKGNVKGSIKHSWKLVQKDVFWTVLLTMLLVLVLTILGAIAFGIGFLITYPIAMLTLTQLYRTLVARPAQEVIVQPVEIPAEAAQ
jgi:membrane-anchored glycerophosphoryl diester phosphodiesterase (GDPDase)